MSCRVQEEREKQAKERGPPKINADVAATRIQKVSSFKPQQLVKTPLCVCVCVCVCVLCM